MNVSGYIDIVNTGITATDFTEGNINENYVD